MGGSSDNFFSHHILEGIWGLICFPLGAHISFPKKPQEPRHEISNNVVFSTSKVSDQPAHTRSLIRAFASRLNILLAEHHLEFLSLKGCCTGLSESVLVKIPHCWKSHVVTQLGFRWPNIECWFFEIVRGGGGGWGLWNPVPALDPRMSLFQGLTR